MPSVDTPPHAPADAAPRLIAFPDLVARVRAGDPRAAAALWRRFAGHVLRCIRRDFLTPRQPLRRDLESDDLAQEAWQSMFTTLRDGRDFASEGDFLRFLFALTRNCFRRHWRARLTAAKRSLRREERFDARRHDRPAPGPGPAEQAASAEERRRLLAGLPEVQRVIVLAVLDGERLAEAAARLGVSARTAQRHLDRIRQRCQRS